MRVVYTRGFDMAKVWDTLCLISVPVLFAGMFGGFVYWLYYMLEIYARTVIK